ncbi:MAG: acetolactate synthase small subunit [Candidatus Raymondbacteria bacterium RifOxyA12_full_50_37]|uniref:Acetolactate synthase small subunit n=1 Tax=Candidatus Raymondbacteria bacterium RIFOXYD12_FULL_49_13 TaxID=1817890 RepID=A0A1F7F5S4_UNCRA|nr:MAG: acetolactate synthase small subunit [Candidatus Raymondbacteria bacterium RifOxyA12_full_50_37]OGJ92104.1 MAG: acetolactate synthase small subunit [Candidatus Raymondbacteria bacterium RIFOXYA2_FULL_49_16]OGJ98460.1 MAG: acetolactate synthase small subunit [Candidatus Raymondbacteria bacterium RIFOXYC2_FULL_50_21]OGK02014.1 MAG: acetolactate synthase small subunit [Candidatus Raymondbacteria bacterium RIFOXYD12_FULL_49_13]OGK03795.1 MAG: acetolactate synthase small subunit [Candidatus R
MEDKHTIIITVANRVGVLARITGLLSARGYNIESIIAAPTENPDIYKVHLVVHGTDEKVEQVAKQLNKLVDTIKIQDISHKRNYIVREFILIKVNAGNARSEIFELVDVFRAKVVDVTKNHIIIDLSGPSHKIERFIELLRPYGIHEFVRSGKVAVSEN